MKDNKYKNDENMTKDYIISLSKLRMKLDEITIQLNKIEERLIKFK